MQVYANVEIQHSGYIRAFLEIGEMYIWLNFRKINNVCYKKVQIFYSKYLIYTGVVSFQVLVRRVPLVYVPCWTTAQNTTASPVSFETIKKRFHFVKLQPKKLNELAPFLRMN